MRWPSPKGGGTITGGSRACLSRPRDLGFEGRQLLEADGAPGMQSAGGDADFGAEAELAAIGELRRGVVQGDGAVDPRKKSARGLDILSDDRIGMLRTIVGDMRHRFIDTG